MSLKFFDSSVGTNMASLGRGFSLRKPKQIKWRFLKHQPTKRKRIDVGRRIIDLRYFAERFDGCCCKCGKEFELKNIIKETNLGLWSSFHFICTNCCAVSVFIRLRWKSEYTYTFIYTLPGLGLCLLNNEIIQGTANIRSARHCLKNCTISPFLS